MSEKKEIMIVDDEADIRDLLFELLSEKGFKVSLARDGEDSIEQMKNHKYDLVITDIEMPRCNGIELLKHMKAAGRKEKIIIMSGSPFSQSCLKEELPPVFSKLIKPFRLTQLMELVSQALAPDEGDSFFAKIFTFHKKAVNAS